MQLAELEHPHGQENDPMKPDSPVFVLTSDIDWAPDDCVAKLANFARDLGIPITFFATHSSPLLESLAQSSGVELGVHPNFAANSTHGTGVETVADHVLAIVPDSRSFRSHQFADSTPIARAMKDRGLEYDSNLCLYLQANIPAMRHASGLIRLPVFWEDDVHYGWDGSSWEVDEYYAHFLTSGLKIINVHPIHFALNTPDADHYSKVRSSLLGASISKLAELRFAGLGTESFTRELLVSLRRDGHEFHKLSEVGDMFRDLRNVRTDEDRGRTDKLTVTDHQTYWDSSDEQKQEQLKTLYGRRNPFDRYATSRDYNQRELEITAIKRVLKDTNAGRLLDLGCGNGYTLVSIAKDVPGWQFEGVDFANMLIEGARQFVAEESDQLVSSVSFKVGDALVELASREEKSLDAVLTERFLLNLPNEDVQRDIIRAIHRVLKPGGHLLMCEGSMEGLRGLNRLRSAMGLEEILANSADNLSSLRFEDVSIEQYVQEIGFTLQSKQGFSLFFAVSRALHPALVRPQKPQFTAPINDLARQAQEALPFEPGIGSNVLWVLRKR